MGEKISFVAFVVILLLSAQTVLSIQLFNDLAKKKIEIKEPARGDNKILLNPDQEKNLKLREPYRDLGLNSGDEKNNKKEKTLDKDTKSFNTKKKKKSSDKGTITLGSTSSLLASSARPTPSPYSINNPDRQIQTKEIEFSIKDLDITLSKINNYDFIILKDSYYAYASGFPDLPRKTFDIRIPKDSQVVSLDIISNNQKEINNLNIAPAQQIELSEIYKKFSKEQLEEIYKQEGYPGERKENKKIYSSDEIFPYQILYYDIHFEGNDKIVRVRFPPITFMPKSKKAFLTTSAKIRLTYTTDFSYVTQNDNVVKSNLDAGGGGALGDEAQKAPEIEWQRTFGGVDYERSESIEQTTDGGYIIAGFTSSFGAGRGDVYLIKTDQNGKKQWEKTFGGEREEYARSVRQTSDKGYIVAGGTKSFGAGEFDIYLIKTDQNGKKQWEKTFGGEDSETAGIIQKTPQNEDFIIPGLTIPLGLRRGDIYLIKIDQNGNLIWEKTFGGGRIHRANEVSLIVKEDHLIIGSGIIHLEKTRSDYYLIKTDQNGNLIWEKTFGGEKEEILEDIKETKDGNFVLGGTSILPERGVYLVKTDQNGNLIWEKIFRGTDPENEYDAESLDITKDDNYVVGGVTWNRRTFSGSQTYLIKVNSNGNLIWEKTFGGEEENFALSIKQTSDLGYIVAGFIRFETGEEDISLVKLKPEKTLQIDTCNNGIKDEGEEGIDCEGVCAEKKKCPVCIPYKINGPTENKIDLVFVPDKDYKNNINLFLNHVQGKINDFGIANTISENVDKFNFYYVKDAGNTNSYRINLPGGTPKFHKNCPFTDSVVLLHKEERDDFTEGFEGKFSAEGGPTRSFLHESGHGIFGLSDQYDEEPYGCNLDYFQSEKFPNIWKSKNACINYGKTSGKWSEAECNLGTKKDGAFTLCKEGWWKMSDFDDNIMIWGYKTDRFDEASKIRINWVFEETAQGKRTAHYYGKSYEQGGIPKSFVVTYNLKDDKLTMINEEIIEGFAPNRLEEEKQFSVKLMTSDGKIADSFNIPDPRRIFLERPENGVHRQPIQLNDLDFTVVFPYYPGLREVQIEDKENLQTSITSDLGQSSIDFCTAHPESIDCEQSDLDNDGIKDKNDNCPLNPNSRQEDSNKNGIGDVCEKQFVRGDANSDGSVDISDPVRILNYLYDTGQILCFKAADANDDGKVDISDPSYILNFLFKDGPSIKQPFPEKGFDPTQDELVCK